MYVHLCLAFYLFSRTWIILRLIAEEGDYTYPFDLDSLEKFEEWESNETEDSNVRASFNYDTLAYENYAGQAINSSVRSNREDEG